MVKKVDIFYIIAFSVLRAFLGVLKLDGYLFIESFILAFSAKLGSNRGNYFSHFLHCLKWLCSLTMLIIQIFRVFFCLIKYNCMILFKKNK